MPLPRGFIAPCLPTKAPLPPSGDAWLHEIKHDGFRVIARKDGERVRLYSRPGNDLTYRFPLIVEALARLRSRSCIIDGEAVCCDEDGPETQSTLRLAKSLKASTTMARPVTSTLCGLVHALPHLLPSSEKREAFLPNLDQCSGSGIAGGPSAPRLDRKGTKAPQFDAVTPGHRGRNLGQDGVDELLNVALVKVRIGQGNALH
jgi:ATP dependent DNA ligase-like protein